MDDPVRADIVRLFQGNPLLRDTAEVLATRLGRRLESVQKALKELEDEGVVAVRWVGGAGLYYFTGAPVQGAALPAEQPTISDEAKPAESVAAEEFALAACLRVPSTLEGIHTGRVAIEGLCRAAGMDPGQIMEFAIAISEAVTNAYRYGRRGDGKDTIRMDFRVTATQVELRVRDRGSGFPSLLVGTSQHDNQSTGGRGLMLMRKLCDDMDVGRSGQGMIVRLVKSLHPAPEESGE